MPASKLHSSQYGHVYNIRPVR